jgi:hypothetical protein
VVATVAKHDLPKNQWPQLFQFLTSYTKSVNPAEREVNEIIQQYKVNKNTVEIVGTPVKYSSLPF